MKFDSFFTASLTLIIYTLISASVLMILYSKVALLKFNSESNVKNAIISLKSPIRWTIGIGLLFLVFWMDFARDYTFKNLNMQMNYQFAIENEQLGLINYTDSFMEKLLENTSSKTIYYMKFLMTCVYSFLFFFITTLLLKLFFPLLRIVPYTFLFYSITFCFMGMFFIFNTFPFSYETSNNFYLISMEIGHLIQSSLTTFLFIVLFKMQSKIASIN